MRIGSFSKDNRKSFGVVHGEMVSDLGALVSSGDAFLKDTLASGKLADLARASAPNSYPVKSVEWLPPLPNPDKIICVGVNYEGHRKETGRAEAEKPTLFLRFANTLIGPGANIW